MSRGVNKVILVGRVGQNPEVRYSPSGTAVANMSLATNSYWKGGDGEGQEKTEWHRLVLFSRTAEIAEQYVKKGTQIYVEGRLQTRKWKDQQGQDRYTTEVVVNDMQLLGGRSDSDYSSRPETDSGVDVGEPVEKPAKAENSNPPSLPDAMDDDDIPF